MTKAKRQKLYKLIERWTRAEIMARFAPIGFPDFADYFDISNRYRDRIRKLMYGTDNLVDLGHRWNILKPPQPKRKQYDKKKA